MGILYGTDQIWWTGRIPNAPARGVERFTDRVHRDGLGCKGWTDAGESWERRAVVEVLVDFIRKDDQVVFDCNVADCGQLFGAEDFSKGVVSV